MGKTILLVLSMGIICGHLYAEKTEVVALSEHQKELHEVKKNLVAGLESCFRRQLSNKQCADQVFKFPARKLDADGCKLGFEGFREIYEATCNENGESTKECALIRSIEASLRSTCKSIVS